MQQEIKFSKILNDLCTGASQQGNCVSEQQVRDAFAELDLSAEQMQLIYDYLKEHKIGIGQPVDPDEYLTDDERDYLQDYLDELDKLPVYTPGQIEAYTIAAMAGETDAGKKLIEIYLRDVVDIAKLYAGQGAYLEDLIGEGNVALAFGVEMLGSLESPDEAQGMLARMMMNAMEEYIAENAECRRADQKIAERVNKVAEQAGAMAEELRRKVTVSELAQESGMSEGRIREAMRISGFQIEGVVED